MAPRNQRPLCLRPHSLYALSNMGRGSRYLPDTENPRILLGRMAGWARNSAGAFVRPGFFTCHRNDVEICQSMFPKCQSLFVGKYNKLVLLGWFDILIWCFRIIYKYICTWSLF